MMDLKLGLGDEWVGLSKVDKGLVGPVSTLGRVYSLPWTFWEPKWGFSGLGGLSEVKGRLQMGCVILGV